MAVEVISEAPIFDQIASEVRSGRQSVGSADATKARGLIDSIIATAMVREDGKAQKVQLDLTQLELTIAESKLAVAGFVRVLSPKFDVNMDIELVNDGGHPGQLVAARRVVKVTGLTGNAVDRVKGISTGAQEALEVPNLAFIEAINAQLKPRHAKVDAATLVLNKGFLLYKLVGGPI